MGSGDYKEKESADDGRHFTQWLFLGTQFPFVAANLQPRQKRQKAFSHWPTDLQQGQRVTVENVNPCSVAPCSGLSTVVQCRKESHLKISRGDLCKNRFFYSHVNVTVFFSAPLMLGALYTLVVLYVTVSVPIWNVFQHRTEFRNSRILLCVWPAETVPWTRQAVSRISRSQKKKHFWEPGGLRVIRFVGLISPRHISKETFPTSADFQRQHSGCAYGQVLQS